MKCDICKQEISVTEAVYGLHACPLEFVLSTNLEELRPAPPIDNNYRCDTCGCDMGDFYHGDTCEDCLHHRCQPQE